MDMPFKKAPCRMGRSDEGGMGEGFGIIGQHHTRIRFPRSRETWVFNWDGTTSGGWPRGERELPLPGK